MGWGWSWCWDARKNSPFLSSVYQFAPGSCQDAWGRRDFGLIEEALSLDHCFGESCFFSICKTGFILQTHYFSKPVLFALVSLSRINILAEAMHTTMCCDSPASLEAVFEQRGEKLDPGSVLTLCLQIDYIALKLGEWLWVEVNVFVIKCLWAVCSYMWIESGRQEGLFIKVGLAAQGSETSSDGANKWALVCFTACPPILRQGADWLWLGGFSCQSRELPSIHFEVWYV